MTGLGFLAVLIALAGLWLARVPGRLERSDRFHRIALLGIGLPILANLSGWLFTELGRQPWVVQGLLLTRDAVSPTVSAWSVGLTLAGFTALYGVLAAVEAKLMIGAAKAGPDAAGTYEPEPSQDGAPARIPALTY
jgi:cytochrome bd ubiquinol oxidase subunit I